MTLCCVSESVSGCLCLFLSWWGSLENTVGYGMSVTVSTRVSGVSEESSETC